MSDVYEWPGRHMGSHNMKPPPLNDENRSRFWINVDDDGEMFLVAVCQECGYTGRRQIEFVERHF